MDAAPNVEQRLRPQRGLAAFAAVIALSAYGGAVGLIAGFIGLDAPLNRRLPFESPVLGGTALALVVGLPMTVLAIRARTGDARTAATAVVAGRAPRRVDRRRARVHPRMEPAATAVSCVRSCIDRPRRLLVNRGKANS